MYWVKYSVLSYSVGNALLPWFIELIIQNKKETYNTVQRLEKNTDIQQVCVKLIKCDSKYMSFCF